MGRLVCSNKEKWRVTPSAAPRGALLSIIVAINEKLDGERHFKLLEVNIAHFVPMSRRKQIEVRN